MLPLLAEQRMRTETGCVVFPGCPIPGSDSWSEVVRAKRIKQGFAKEQEAQTKPKAKSRKTKAKSKDE